MGDIPVTLGGASYGMRPAYGVVRDIEARSGLTIRELLDVTIAERLKYEEALIVIWTACQAVDRPFDDMDQLGKVIFERRLTDVDLRSSIAKFLLACLYVPEDAAKKWDAEVGPVIEATATG